MTATAGEGTREGSGEGDGTWPSIARVGVWMVFQEAAVEWAKAGGGSVHSVFRKQRLVGWTRSLHAEIVGNRVRK